MPGAVARTSTYALTNATTPYILLLADLRFKKAVKESYALRRALNMFHGELMIEEVAETFNISYKKYEAGE